MKRYDILVILTALFAFYSCNDSEIDGYKSELAPGGAVQAVLVSPSSKTLYVDSDFPVLNYICVPANAADTTITWSSDQPDILKVDPKTGKLSWGNIRNSEVIITATSNTGGAQGSCVFTIKNAMGVYQYLDCRKELGLWILDRNLGASKPFKTGDPSYSNSSIGNYYQWGRNAVVCNREFGGPDGKGGKYQIPGNWTYPEHYQIGGGYPTFILGWNGEGEDYVDWSIPANTPCPAGWRLPTVADVEKMIYQTDPNNFVTAVEKGAAKILRDKLALGHTGYTKITGDWWNGYEYWCWTSDWDPVTKMAQCMIAQDVDHTGLLTIRKLAVLNTALPIRCVKDGKIGEDESESD